MKHIKVLYAKKKDLKVLIAAMSLYKDYLDLLVVKDNSNIKQTAIARRNRAKQILLALQDKRVTEEDLKEWEP
jgi:hypothetical protein